MTISNNAIAIDTLFALSVQAHQAGKYSEAALLYQRVLQSQPQHAHGLHLLGLCKLQQGDAHTARRWIDAAIAVDSTQAAFHLNLGNALAALQETSAALAAFQQAQRLDPQLPETYYNLGKAYAELDDAALAEKNYRHALRLRPQWPDVFNNLGTLLRDRGDFAGADACYRAALDISAEHRDAQFNWSVLQLLQGRYRSGWLGYRLRERTTATATATTLPAPEWRGDNLRGKTLLIRGEQGLGEEIMFASLLPELIAQAQHCIIECSPKLHSTFARSFPQATVITTDRSRADWRETSYAQLQLLPVDYRISTGNLPALRISRATDFPQHTGYLRADPQRIDHWRTQLAALGPGLKVGISWRGGTPTTGRTRRSLSLVQLLPPLNLPGVKFVSLQYTPCDDDIATLQRDHGITVQHWQHAVDNYDETLALVAGLDLVISVCTAVIHVAGALHRPVWVLTPLVPGWHYGAHGDTMRWYPSVRLLRQTQAGDWDAVIARTQKELESFLVHRNCILDL